MIVNKNSSLVFKKIMNLNLEPEVESLISSPGVGVRTGPYIPLYPQPQYVHLKCDRDTGTMGVVHSIKQI